MEFKCGTCEEGPQPDITAHYFRMVKKGNGWKTTGYFRRDGDKIPPTSEWLASEAIPLHFTTLGKIKKTFSETTSFTYVIDSHLYLPNPIPTKIYQVVVEFRKASDLKAREELWKGTKETICYDVHYEYKYVNDIPGKVLHEWKDFEKSLLKKFNYHKIPLILGKGGNERSCFLLKVFLFLCVGYLCVIPKRIIALVFGSIALCIVMSL